MISVHAFWAMPALNKTWQRVPMFSIQKFHTYTHTHTKWRKIAINLFRKIAHKNKKKTKGKIGIKSHVESY